MRYLPGPAATPAEGDILTPLLTDNMISTQTLVVRRDRFHDLGGFDPGTTPIEDWDFAIRLAEAGPIAFVDEPLVHQRFSPNSITRDTAAKLAGRIRLVERNRAAFARHPALLARQYRYIANSFFWERRDRGEARRWLGRALGPTRTRAAWPMRCAWRCAGSAAAATAPRSGGDVRPALQQRIEIADRLHQPLLERDRRLPVEQRLRAADVRPALQRVVLGQRPALDGPSASR